MTNAKTKFKGSLDRYFRELHFIDSQLELFEKLDKFLKDKAVKTKVSPIFFIIVKDSLLFNSITALSKYFEKEIRSDRNLAKFLNYIEQNMEQIFSNGKNEEKFKTIKKLIKQHRENLSNSKKIIDKLITWRDQYLTHFDNKYFLNPKDIVRDIGLTIMEIQELTIMASEMLNDYSCHFDGSYTVLKAVGQGDVENIFYLIAKHSKKNQGVCLTPNEPDV